MCGKKGKTLFFQSKHLLTMTRSVLQSFQSSKSLAWQRLNLYQHFLQGYVFLSIFYLVESLFMSTYKECLEILFYRILFFHLVFV
jgi:hypothetical protein